MLASGRVALVRRPGMLLRFVALAQLFTGAHSALPATLCVVYAGAVTRARASSMRAGNPAATRGPGEANASTWASRKVRLQVLERDGWVCRWCSRPVHPRCSTRGCHDDATVDHLAHWRDAPHLRHDPANLVTACRWCNLSRGVGDRPRPRPARAGVGGALGRTMAGVAGR